MSNKYINGLEIYKNPALFHIYLTERKRRKTDTKAWSFLEQIIENKEINLVGIRRRWRDSLYCSKPLFEDLIYKFCDEKGIKQSKFEYQEKGVFFENKRRIFFYDLFSYQRARGGISRIMFEEIVYEKVIPIDQEFLSDKGGSEQGMFRDLLDSLKRKNNNLKVTILANPYIGSSGFLNNFEEKSLLIQLKNEVIKKKDLKDNSRVLLILKDEKGIEGLLYINLIEGEPDAHSSSLEERTNPLLRNGDDFMIFKPNKYLIIHSIQDYFLYEIGERKKFKKYCLIHFTKNVKEINNNLVNYCFFLEDKAKSKLMNCILKEKFKLSNIGVNMLKTDILKFTDFRSRDGFLEQIK